MGRQGLKKKKFEFFGGVFLRYFRGSFSSISCCKGNLAVGVVFLTSFVVWGVSLLCSWPIGSQPLPSKSNKSPSVRPVVLLKPSTGQKILEKSGEERFGQVILSCRLLLGHRDASLSSFQRYFCLALWVCRLGKNRPIKRLRVVVLPCVVNLLSFCDYYREPLAPTPYFPLFYRHVSAKRRWFCDANGEEEEEDK